MKIQSFEEGQKYLFAHIPKGQGNKYPGDLGIKRIKYFLNLIGNPQNKLKVIHIAGTSGKGSTAYMTSRLLISLGLKTGLAISPHLIDIRERVQVNNQLIEKSEFCRYLNQLIPYINQLSKTEFGSPTYFEILVVLAFSIFYQEKVDYAVIETGLGGLYDGTNSVSAENKLVILTNIGFDHIGILGDTLDKIAYQKAMIIHKKNVVISADQEPDAKKIIKEISDQNEAQLFYIKKPDNYKNIKVSQEKTTFDFTFNNFILKDISLNLIGDHQAQNASLALAAVFLLGKRDHFKIYKKIIEQALDSVYFQARMEIIKHKGKTVVIDGAHNPQKMETFLRNLKKIYPHQKFQFLIGFKKGKDFAKMLKSIVSLADKIIITGFFTQNQDWLHMSETPEEIAVTLQKLEFDNYEIIKDSKEALKTLISQPKDILVITGSLYLISEIYPLLFPPNLRG